MSEQGSIYLCSFYSDKYQYRFAARRIRRQLNALGIFKSTFLYSEKDFFKLLDTGHKNLSAAFKQEKKNPGFAYWAWKPIVINETLKLIPEHSILLYIDIGCNLIQNNYYWNKIRKKVLTDQIITAYSYGHGFNRYGEQEYNWTKPEIFRELKTSIEDQNSPQYQATWVMLINNSRNREFIKEWQYFCTVNELLLVKPAVNENPLNSKLIEHKNDQAIFSCLIKKNSLKPTVANSEDMTIIKTSRNLSIFSFSESTLINRMIKFLERRIIRILNKILL